jgi:hypothetical protein
MSYIGKDWPDADETEDRPYGLDFVRKLGDGELINSATAIVELVKGVDPDYLMRIYGTVAIEGSICRQWASDLVPGCKYRIKIDVDTDQGRRLSYWSHVTCVSRLVA